MNDKLKPFGIEDNPIMAAAFSSFCHWIFGQEWAHEEFRADTGLVRPATSGINAAVDEASGYYAQYAAKFIEWAIVNHWGEDEKDTPQ